MRIDGKVVWFSMAALFQLALLASIPSRQLEALQAGRTIRLKARAANRDNIWSGAYLRLEYDISRPTGLQEFKPGTTVFVLLRQEDDGAWKADRILKTKPAEPEAGRVLIRGTIRHDQTPIHTELRRQPDGSWQAGDVEVGRPERPHPESEDLLVARAWLPSNSIVYGLEDYYVPADRREAIENDLRQHWQEVTAEVKVDKEGNAALLRVLIQGRIYDF